MLTVLKKRLLTPCGQIWQPRATSMRHPSKFQASISFAVIAAAGHDSPILYHGSDP
jgi:hypothetical protein